MLRVENAPEALNASMKQILLSADCSCPVFGHRSAPYQKDPSSLEYTPPSLVPRQGSEQSPSHGFRFFIVKTVSESNCLKQHPSVSKQRLLL